MDFSNIIIKLITGLVTATITSFIVVWILPISAIYPPDDDNKNYTIATKSWFSYKYEYFDCTGTEKNLNCVKVEK